MGCPASQAGPWQQRSVLTSSIALRFVAALACAAGAGVFWFLYFSLYWAHRDRFNEAGRDVDQTTMVVHHAQSGVLAVPAVALSILALVFAFLWRSARRLHKAQQEARSSAG
ncbi:MAG TPA: hypothetical protein VFK82_00375 [Burkholderiaceae bacterium]|nr:hypothetical protein [Burkholderiaceae bacterium]